MIIKERFASRNKAFQQPGSTTHVQKESLIAAQKIHLESCTQQLRNNRCAVVSRHVGIGVLNIARISTPAKPDIYFYFFPTSLVIVQHSRRLVLTVIVREF